MGQRQNLQTVLKTLCDNVYFQPPSDVTMQYPAIRYERADSDTRHANNKPYHRAKRYLVTVITKDPDSLIPDQVAALPTAVHNRFFAANSLNHDVFYIYF